MPGQLNTARPIHPLKLCTTDVQNWASVVLFMFLLRLDEMSEMRRKIQTVTRS